MSTEPVVSEHSAAGVIHTCTLEHFRYQWRVGAQNLVWDRPPSAQLFLFLATIGMFTIEPHLRVLLRAFVVEDSIVLTVPACRLSTGLRTGV